MENKFECKKCGKCCKEFGTITLPDTQQEVRGLKLYEWERKRLLDKAREQKIKLNILPLIESHDVKSRTNLVLEYHLKIPKGQPCPFLINNQCSIYEDRPAICKSYPILSLEPPIIDTCPEIKKFDLFSERIEKKTLFKIFGKCFLVSIQDLIIMDTLLSMVTNLDKLGKIQLPLKDGKIKIVKTKPFLDFLILNGHETREEVKNLINSFENCDEYAQKYVNGLIKSKGGKK